MPILWWVEEHGQSDARSDVQGGQVSLCFDVDSSHLFTQSLCEREGERGREREREGERGREEGREVGREEGQEEEMKGRQYIYNVKSTHTHMHTHAHTPSVF